jgi:hypothetical protein
MGIEDDVNAIEEELREQSESVVSSLFSESLKIIAENQGGPEQRKAALMAISAVAYAAGCQIHDDRNEIKLGQVIAQVQLALVTAATALGMPEVKLFEWKEAIIAFQEEMDRN